MGWGDYMLAVVLIVKFVKDAKLEFLEVCRYRHGRTKIPSQFYKTDIFLS